MRWIKNFFVSRNGKQYRARRVNNNGQKCSCTPVAYLGYWNYFVALTKRECDPKILGDFAPVTSCKKGWKKCSIFSKVLFNKIYVSKNLWRKWVKYDNGSVRTFVWGSIRVGGDTFYLLLLTTHYISIYCYLFRLRQIRLNSFANMCTLPWL